MEKTNIFLISGPSGAGEDSILEKIQGKLNYVRPITTTTREIRPGEVHGENYYYISKEEFGNGIGANDFFEWAEADNGNFYGITHKEINRVKTCGKIVLWKIDFKGVLTLKKLLPEVIAIMINAPFEILEKRIRNRNQVTEEFVQGRLEYAKGWIENKDSFDFIVENEEGKLDETVEKVLTIIKSFQF